MTNLVTGGAGFIGSALCHALLDKGEDVVVLDSMTYAANPLTVDDLLAKGALFEKADIRDAKPVREIITRIQPSKIYHLAAETHVDRSIDSGGVFVETNVMGTFNLLEAARNYYEISRPLNFKFVHVSTDEVFGSLGGDGLFSESSPYNPSSPYSASKAASDHLVRAVHGTYGLPVVISNCSNNYGPRQFPEKLIPLMVLNAADEKALPVYGNGLNVRDWLFVEDHADALITVAERGEPGETYLIGGQSEKTNIDIVETICGLMDAQFADRPTHTRLIEFVADRPGHDKRYAVDISKIEQELGWSPKVNFTDGLAKTVDWYMQNEAWWQPIRDGTYQGQRLGLTGTVS